MNLRIGSAVRMIKRAVERCGAFLLLMAVCSGALGPAKAQSIKTSGGARVRQEGVHARAARFEPAIERAARREGVDPNVLWTIAYLETRFRPWLKSPKNAQGMMQFIPATARRFGLEDPYDAVASIDASARYVKYLSRLFGGRLDSVLAAYNSGEGTVAAYLTGRALRTGSRIINPGKTKRAGGVPPYAETMNYVKNGIRIYRWLLQRGTFPAALIRAKSPSGDFGKSRRIAKQGFPTPIRLRSGLGERTAAAQRETDNKGETSIKQIFYEPRSGSRYLVDGETGGKVIPVSDGQVVISENSRPFVSRKGRSILFAGQK
jgi:hypothetical protein